MDFLSATSFLASSVVEQDLVKTCLTTFFNNTKLIGMAHFIDVKLAMHDTLQPPLIRGQLQEVNNSPAEKKLANAQEVSKFT